MIIVNTKNYKKGDELLKLCKLIESYDVHTIVSVPAPEIYRIAAKTALNVYAQHCDSIQNEKSTGHISAFAIRTAGGSGTLINHSEKKLSLENIKEIITQCKEAHIVSIVCAQSIAEVDKIAQFKPSAIAFEDPQLVSTGKPITAYRQHDILNFVKKLKGKPIVPLCGAGITSAKDVESAYKLGCKGVLIASAIANNKYPQELLESLAKRK
jgi:triosephosphate isomerase